MADQTLKYNEAIVGSGHPTMNDTANRLALVEHNTDGTHKGASVLTAIGATPVPTADMPAIFDSRGVMRGAEWNFTEKQYDTTHNGTASYDYGTVAVGDIIAVEAQIHAGWGGIPTTLEHYLYNAGSCTLEDYGMGFLPRTNISLTSNPAHSSIFSWLEVTAAGTLVICSMLGVIGGSGLSYDNVLKTFFAKKA